RQEVQPVHQHPSASGSINRRMVRPTVDLPHPDSPTRPSVWPEVIANETSSTARTTARGRPSPKKARSPGKCLTSPCTSTSAEDDVTNRGVPYGVAVP